MNTKSDVWGVYSTQQGSRGGARAGLRALGRVGSVGVVVLEELVVGDRPLSVDNGYDGPPDAVKKNAANETGGPGSILSACTIASSH